MKASTPPDENNTAARVGRKKAKHSDAIPVGLQQAWEEWSQDVGKVDIRTLALLRVAFEAGAEAFAAAKGLGVDMSAWRKAHAVAHQ